MNASEEGPLQFARDGFAVYPRVFDSERIKRFRAEADRLRRPVDSLTEHTWDGSVRWLIQRGEGGRSVLRGLQFPYRISALLDGVRTDIAIRTILEPLIGPNIVSIVGSLFWKPAGARETVIAYHQDASFRKPPEKYRNLARSNVQLGVALDPHGPENGGMRFVVGSHKRGELDIERASSVMSEAPTNEFLERLGFSPDDTRDIAIDAGDVVIWHPHLLHGSPPNQSRQNDRLFYTFSYMRQDDTEDGELAFLEGRPCPLDIS